MRAPTTNYRTRPQLVLQELLYRTWVQYPGIPKLEDGALPLYHPKVGFFCHFILHRTFMTIMSLLICIYFLACDIVLC